MYLLERHTVSYLTSGRDLLRAPSTPGHGVIVFADPTFAERQRTASTLPRLFSFAPLPGAREEADQIVRLLGSGQVFAGRDATETRLKAVVSPRILHVATHGFFLGSGLSPVADARGVALVSNQRPKTSLGVLEPLLRSGLAFQGANLGQGIDGGDGILTALEAMSLSLNGTRLVVLSACDTGLGLIRSGESVYGLRRALSIAGAETQVMTLWGC